MNILDKLNIKNTSPDIFEDRICKKCKFSSGARSSRYNRDVDSRHCTILNQIVDDTFGCNKFKKK